MIGGTSRVDARVALIVGMLALAAVVPGVDAGAATTVVSTEESLTHSGSGTLDVTVAFSESVDNFVAGSMTVSGCAVNTVVTVTAGLEYEVNLDTLGTADCDVSLDGGAVVATVGGEDNIESNHLVFVYGPVATIATTSGNDYHNAVSAVGLTITLSASSTDFAIGDLGASGCTLDNFAGSGTSYTVDATPSGTGVCTISSAASQWTDTATSSANHAATSLSLYHGIPSVVLDTTDSNSGTHDGDSVINMRVTFGSPVDDFLENDITISGGSVSSPTEAVGANAGKQWTFVVTPSGGVDNIQIFIQASKTQATSSGMWNTASNIVTFVYTTQWGLVSLTDATSHASRGQVSAAATVSGSTSTVTMENAKWHSVPGDDDTEGVKVCLTRAADASLSAAALAGTMTVRLTVSTGSLTDVIVNADEDNDTGTPVSTTYGYDQAYDSPLSTAGTFDLKWGDEEVGTRCFYIGRTAWASVADDACTVAASSFDLTIAAYDVEEDEACTSGTGCGDNARYFTNEMSTITIARSVDVMPDVKILTVADMTPLFDVTDAPPDYNAPMYAQDEPKRLLVLERDCVGEQASATDTDTTYFSSVGDVDVTFANALAEVAGSEGIEEVNADNVKWYDITSDYTGTDMTWTEVLAVSLGTAVDEVGWTGIECGASSRKYVLAHFHDGDGTTELTSTEVATFSLAESSAISLPCATSAYIATNPAVTFTIRNDPTRDSTVFDTGAATNPIDMRVWFGDAALSGSDFTVDVAQRLHLSGENAKEALHVVGLGTGLEMTGSGYRFPDTTIDDMCTSLSSTFEVALAGLGPTVDTLFDGIFAGSTAYQSSATADETYGPSGSDNEPDLTVNPFYPFNSGEDSDVVSSAWTAIAASATSGEVCYLGGETTTSKFCARHTIAGTLSELRACKNWDGSDVLTIVNDLDAGTTTYSLKVFSQIISYRGTDPDDRDWETLQTVTKDFSFSFDTNVVSSVWTDTAAISAEVDLLSFTTESCDSGDCAFAGYMNIDTDRFMCNCNDACPASALFKRGVYQVMVDIPRSDGRETGGDVGIRDTIHTLLAPATQSDGGFETCYGLETSSALSAVQFVDEHDSLTTKNRFIITARTECLPMYDYAASANADDAFTSCDSALFLANYDLRVVLSQLRDPGASWAQSLASRAGDSSFIDAGTMPLSVEVHYQQPLVAPSIGTDETADYTNVVTKLFKDPDYQAGGSWAQDSSSADLTDEGLAGGAVTFLQTDRLIVTQELDHAATKNELTLHIRDVHVCTLNPDSEWFNCLHPGSTDPAADTGFGAFVTQAACPTGSWDYLQYSCDAAAWDQYVDTIGSPTATQISPIASSWDFVRNYLPTAPWSGETGAESAFLCRYPIKSAAAKARPGSTAFFCTSFEDTDTYCGDDSTTYNNARQAGTTALQWDKLAGFGVADLTATVRGSDAVEVPLAGLPAGQDMVVTVRSQVVDCGDGSEHDGARRLRHSSGRFLSEFSSEAGSTAGSSGSALFEVSPEGGAVASSGGSGDWAKSAVGISVILCSSVGLFLLGSFLVVKRRGGSCCWAIGGGRNNGGDDDEEEEGLVVQKKGGGRSSRSARRGGPNRP